jgi:hypothetical protein
LLKLSGALPLDALDAGADLTAAALREEALRELPLATLLAGTRVTTICLELPRTRTIAVRDFPLPAYLPCPRGRLAASVRIGCLISTMSARTAESVSFSTVGDTAGKTAVSPACIANS